MKETASVTLLVKRLASIVRELPNVDVTVDASPNHQVKLSSGGSTFRIMGIGRDEFPAPAGASATRRPTPWSRPSSADAGKAWPTPSPSTRTATPSTGSISTSATASLLLVATDGRRLAVIGKEMEVPAASAGAIILPAKTVGELTRLLDKGEKVNINFNDRRCAFQIATDKDSSGLVDSVYLYPKVVEGQNYPNHQQVIPKETHQRDQARAGSSSCNACTGPRWSAPRSRTR